MMKLKKANKFVTVFFSSLLAFLLVTFAVSAATTISTNIQTNGTLSVSGLASLLGSASTTRLSLFDRLYVGGTGTTTIFGDTSTSTFSGGVQTPLLYVSSTTASSTFANGINLTAGCFSISGSCVGGSGGASVSSANTWTALQQFQAGASSTLASVYGTLYVGGTATTTIAGNNGTSVFSGAVTVSGLTTLGNASTTVLSTTGNFTVNGNATTTASNGNIATQGTLTLANGSTAISGVVFGFCTISNSANIAAGTAGYFDCTGATGITTAHRVFVQATSSLPSNLTLQAASSTAANTINLQIRNVIDSITNTAPGSISINFFGIR